MRQGKKYFYLPTGCEKRKTMLNGSHIICKTYRSLFFTLSLQWMKSTMRGLILFLLVLPAFAGTAQPGCWHVQLHREDGNDIVFTFEWKTEKGKPVWYIHNASEKIRVNDITIAGDSVIVQMPVFESQFRLTYHNKELRGVWMKENSGKTQVIAFTAQPGNQRFTVSKAASKNISGRWSVIFVNNNIPDTSVAEFKQQGNHVTGTFLTATGDYRYQEGVVRNDSLFLSCFDGGHAFLFAARIDNNKKISGGYRYSGATFKEDWTAMKNAHAVLSFDASAMYLKHGEERLDFTFNDLDGKPVSINDKRFKNKVVVVQLMGSWCPNCMDETAFLTEYYNKNRQRGFEVIALAYEYSTDLVRSTKSLRKFQQRFNVQYPMLNTGVAVNDSLRTEKTLPQLTPIKSFPSSVIIDKKGRVRKLDVSFNGPGTGEHYFVYKKEFEETIESLLKEN
jgi:peroxiredoxin